MNFADCRDKTEEYLSFGNYSDVQPKPNLASLVQEAYREIATESEYNFEDATFPTVVGTKEYTLTNPPDWIRITDVLWGTTTLLGQSDEVTIRRHDPLWFQASNAQPIAWWVSKPNVIRLYPPPSSVETCYVHGSRVPTAFVLDADLPTFPVRYHESIPLRAAWRHLKKIATGDEYKRGLNYFEESNRIVSDLKEEIQGQNSGVFKRQFLRRVPEKLYLGGRVSVRY